MADAATGFDRGMETTGYSPVVGGDRRTTDRMIRSAVPDDAHDGPQPDLATLLRLGALKLETGNDAEAEEFFRKALEIGDRTVGPDHPDMILLINDLTRIYLKQSAYASAEPLLLRLLEMKRSKGEDHPEVATVMASLATVRQALGRHESAEQLWRRVLEIRERTLAPNHFAIATALEHFGEACSARGKIRDALAAFQRAHTIRERTLGSDHSSLRASRERIADLQLQASDGSLEPGGGVGSPSGPEKYRLLSGEPITFTAPPTPTREKGRAPNARKATLLIPGPFSESPPIGTASVADEASADVAAPSQPETAAHRDIIEKILQPEATPYRDALESIREEVERQYERVSLAERVRAISASVTPFLGRREVVAGAIVLVLSLLLVAVATGSHALGETDQTTSLGAPLPSRVDLPGTGVAATSTLVVPSATATNNPVSVSAPAIPNAPSKTSIQRPRVAEERGASTKGTEQKSESRIAMPKLSKATMSRLDSVAATAANVAVGGGDPVINQPGPVSMENRRSTFDIGEAAVTGPQRARLIGELPTPRVPIQISDVEGEVRVRFNVDTDGRPVMSTLSVQASPNPLLTSAVRKVIPSIRFEPARSGGADSKPIGDVVEIGFRFAGQNR